MDTASLNANTVRLVKAGSTTPIAVMRETSTDASGRTVLTLPDHAEAGEGNDL
jgi:hypothetical protein